VAYAFRAGQKLEEIRLIGKGIRGEARVQVFQNLAVSAPAVESQVSRTDEEMAVFFRGENRYLG
jgi:hypothetical protein